MEQARFLDLDGGRIYWRQYGNGPERLIGLHGFGDSARFFGQYEAWLGNRYTLLAFDLPFHGQTVWHKADFTPDDLSGIFNGLQKMHGHKSFGLIAYSFGARLVLGMLSQSALRPEQLILLAPDGFGTRGLGLAQRTPPWMRRSVYTLVRRPQWVLHFASFAGKYGLMPPLYRVFLERNLSNTGRIRRLFGCWASMRVFPIKKREIEAFLQKNPLPLHIYVGDQDPFIRVENIRKWCAEIPLAHIHVLSGQGHHLRMEGVLA